MSSKIIAFDLDDVLCRRSKEARLLPYPEEYTKCTPMQEQIDVVNELYDEGFYIKIYTARGMCGFKGDIFKVYENLYPLTKQQLIDWEVKHHELIMGKAHYDLLIDDKALNSFSSLVKNSEGIINWIGGK